MVSFEIFVKAMPPSLSELKVLPSFCFAFKIPDDMVCGEYLMLVAASTCGGGHSRLAVANGRGAVASSSYGWSLQAAAAEVCSKCLMLLRSYCTPRSCCCMGGGSHAGAAKRVCFGLRCVRRRGGPCSNVRGRSTYAPFPLCLASGPNLLLACTSYKDNSRGRSLCKMT